MNSGRLMVLKDLLHMLNIILHDIVVFMIEVLNFTSKFMKWGSFSLFTGLVGYVKYYNR